MNYDEMLDFVKYELPNLRGKYAKISRKGDFSVREISRIISGETKEPRPSTLRKIIAGINLIK